MGITLPHVTSEMKDQYLVSDRHIESWKDQFDQYIDRFDFHSMLKMPGSVLEQSGALMQNIMQHVVVLVRQY